MSIEAATATPVSSSHAEEPLALAWRQPAGMVGLSFKNFLLRIPTLGLYGFWGKTEVRQRIWAAIRLNGEPLIYTGTGKELFVGFLIVLGAVVVPLMLVSLVATVAFGPNSPLLGAFQALTYGVIFYLIGIGVHRAQRYRLARTSWRGIRGGLEGNSSTYAWAHVWTAVVAALTLGWLLPWRATKLQGLITNGMRFGDRPFRFDARPGPLYPRFAVLWIGTIAIAVLAFAALQLILATLGVTLQRLGQRGNNPGPYVIAMVIVAFYAALFLGALLYGVLSAWYRARMMNHFAAHTTFEGARFAGAATAGSLIWLTFSNYAMTLLSLGLLAPVAQARSARYFIERLSIAGTAPLSGIVQRADDGSKRGEGLAQAFDVDAF